MVQEVERTALKSLDPGAITTAVRRAIAEQHDLQLYGFQLLKPGSLPKTSSGKIRRFQCRAGYLDHQLSDVYTWQFNTQEADLEGDALSDLTDTRLGNGNSPRHPLSCPFPASNAQSLEELQEWLKRWLSETLDMPIAEIDGDRPFAEYGLDSVAAVELTEALQASVQAPLSPTLVYEYPTIEAVAAYLGEHMGLLLPEDAVSASSAADEADLADLLSELDGLSVAEVEQLLGQQGR
jgi:acyl carrier protein